MEEVTIPTSSETLKQMYNSTITVYKSARQEFRALNELFIEKLRYAESILCETMDQYILVEFGEAGTEISESTPAFKQQQEDCFSVMEAATKAVEAAISAYMDPSRDNSVHSLFEEAETLLAEVKVKCSDALSFGSAMKIQLESRITKIDELKAHPIVDIDSSSDEETGSGSDSESEEDDSSSSEEDTSSVTSEETEIEE